VCWGFLYRPCFFFCVACFILKFCHISKVKIWIATDRSVSPHTKPQSRRFLHITNGGHTRKSIMAAPMFLRIRRSILSHIWLKQRRICMCKQCWCTHKLYRNIYSVCECICTVYTCMKSLQEAFNPIMNALWSKIGYYRSFPISLHVFNSTINLLSWCLTIILLKYVLTKGYITHIKLKK
jgi:hypothetical protein